MIDWAGKVGIIDDMGLCAANLGREPRGQSRAARDLAAGMISRARWLLSAVMISRSESAPANWP
jgi:hypothetical protein